MLAAGLSALPGNLVDISFRSKKLANILNSESLLKREYGVNAPVIKVRLATLEAVECLAEVPTTPPERRHLLTGKFTGCYAVDLRHPWRLVFQPAEDPPPKKRDGGHDLQKITSIVILDILDYH